MDKKKCAHKKVWLLKSVYKKPNIKNLLLKRTPSFLSLLQINLLFSICNFEFFPVFFSSSNNMWIMLGFFSNGVWITKIRDRTSSISLRNVNSVHQFFLLPDLSPVDCAQGKWFCDYQTDSSIFISFWLQMSPKLTIDPSLLWEVINRLHLVVFLFVEPKLEASI